MSNAPAYLRKFDRPAPIPAEPLRLRRRYHVLLRVSTFQPVHCTDAALFEDEALAEFNALRGFYRDMGFQVRGIIDGVKSAFVVEHNGKLLCSVAIEECE